MEAKKYNLNIAMCSERPTFFDYDDGDRRCFLINPYVSPFNYGKVDTLIKTKGILIGDRLYENGKFFDATEKTGLTNTTLLSYRSGLFIGDLNNNGRPDVYVANDHEGKYFPYLHLIPI